MTPPDAEPAAPAETADADLVLRSRSGDTDAFGELWRRHYASGIAVARSITSSIDADDLVQEAYTRIFRAIQRGGGPTGAFRAYLFTSIRNTAAAWGRGRREVTVDELDAVAEPSIDEQTTDEALDRGLTTQAFRSLPTRWQEVLWYTEIEQMKPAAVAPLLGMSANAVAQLAVRAREGLREAWIQAHLLSVEEGSDCRRTIDLLGAYSRGNLGRRDRARVDAHLSECARCTIVAGEAHEVSRRLAIVLLPLFLGAGATGYGAWLQTGAPATILAAMPSSVVHGAVVAGGAGASAGAGAGAGGAGAGGAGSGGAGAGGGALSSTGAMVGLVAAGVVVAASIAVGAVFVPRLIAGSAPAPTVAEAPAVVAPPTTQDAAPAPAPPPATTAPMPPPAAPIVVAPPVAPPASAPVAPPASAPVAAPKPAPTTTPAPAPTPTPTPTPTPVLPAGAPSFGTAAWTSTSWTLSLALSGAPGATVQVQLGTDPAQTVVLDDAGAGSVTIRVKPRDFRLGTPIAIRYTADGQVGPAAQSAVGDLITRP